MTDETPKVLILCGGRGTRMSEPCDQHQRIRILSAVCCDCGRIVTPDTDSRLDTVFKIEGVERMTYDCAVCGGVFESKEVHDAIAHGLKL